MSRQKKASLNDADRLRKYLARFDLTWDTAFANTPLQLMTGFKYIARDKSVDDDDNRFDLNNSIMYLLSSDLLDLDVARAVLRDQDAAPDLLDLDRVEPSGHIGAEVLRAADLVEQL